MLTMTVRGALSNFIIGVMASSFQIPMGQTEGFSADARRNAGTSKTPTRTLAKDTTSLY